MPLDPSAVTKWSASEWNRQVQMIRPSDGGAQGVLFVYVMKRPEYSPGIADFVVKPVSESAANTTVAERLIRKVAGAKTLDSHAVKPSSSLGKAIIATADAYAKRKDYRWDDRVRELAGHLRNARSILIQHTAQFSELADVLRADAGLAGVLRNAVLMKNFGRLYVADAVLGNGDRFDRLNTGNIAFDADGSVVAIDSAALLTKFSALVRDAQCEAGDMKFSWTTKNAAAISREGWVQGTMQGASSAPQPSDYQRIELGHGARSVATAGMHLLFDPPALWQQFRSSMEAAVTSNQLKVRANGGTPPRLASPPDWEAARQPFIDGVLDGLQQVDTMLSGLSWLKTKFHFKAARAKHGTDANLSWTNFKMRRIVAKHAARGLPIEDAFAYAESYASRKTRTVDF